MEKIDITDNLLAFQDGQLEPPYFLRRPPHVRDEGGGWEPSSFLPLFASTFSVVCPAPISAYVFLLWYAHYSWVTVASGGIGGEFVKVLLLLVRGPLGGGNCVIDKDGCVDFVCDYGRPYYYLWVGFVSLSAVMVVAALVLFVVLNLLSMVVVHVLSCWRLLCFCFNGERIAWMRLRVCCRPLVVWLMMFAVVVMGMILLW